MRWYIGGGYLAFTIGCSVAYLVLVAESLTNDLFWPDFDPVGGQLLLVDLFHRLRRADSFDLYATPILKTYNTPSAASEMLSTTPRAIALSQLTSIEDAILGFRTLDAAYSLHLMSQYCFVDLHRRWELAHTAARQARCNQGSLAVNGAVYLETLLRNVEWESWIVVFATSFQLAIADELERSHDGIKWLQSVQNAFESVSVEARYWRAHGIQRYQLQWSNDVQFGLRETISLINALGTVQELTTYNLPFTHRGSLWTSFYQQWGFFDDLWAASVVNGSLVRSAANFMGHHSSMEALAALYPFTRSSICIHDTVGPFVSTDMYLVPPPASLLDAVSALEASVSMRINAAAFTQLLPQVLDPIPMTWRHEDAIFFGGNPFCALTPGASFVQKSFAFDATCTAMTPASVVVSPMAAAFATAVDDAPRVGCDACRTLAPACRELLSHVVHLVQDANVSAPDMSLVQAAIADLGVEVIQFALLNTSHNHTALRQPLLGKGWTFFGYIMLYEWAIGHREVVSFQGDVTTFVLMSEPLAPLPLALSGSEIPYSTSRYFWQLAVITTIGLTGLALMLLLLGARHWRNSAILRFNRIAAPVWLGRPLLLVRSITGIMVLSTAPIAFDASPGRATFCASPRSVPATLLIAGEAVWLTYVATDLCVIVTEPFTRYYAPLSSLLSWIAIVSLEMTLPVSPKVSVAQVCTRTNVNVLLTCSIGTVHIGSLTRALVIALLQVASLLVAYAIVRLALRRHPPPPPPMASYIVPASLAAFADAPLDAWAMHRVVALLSGSLRLQPHWFFDVIQDTLVEIPSSRLHRIKRRVTLGVGLTYLVATVGGSLSYLELSTVSLANDFYWATFNTTGAQTYVANWFNRYLYMTPTLLSASLANDAYGDTTNYGDASAVVAYSLLYAKKIQFEVASDLALAIHGLRQTDPCLIPWITTQYCWLDLDRRWDMANSIKRQARCEMFYTTNAAVYLEAPLRNLKWPDFEACWGASFDMAFGADLLHDISGRTWLATVQSNANSELDEVVYWQSKGLLTYTVQWQSYKKIGLVDTFAIENAFGLTYALTLKATRGLFHIATETSMKMYWGLASDLWAIATNGSGVTGRSLLRSSSYFAFANTTPEAMYVVNSTLSSPRDAALGALETFLGPFGSVDLRYVSPPARLLRLQQSVLEALSVALVAGENRDAAQAAYSRMSVLGVLVPRPLALDPSRVACLGGSLLCGAVPRAMNFSLGMGSFFGADAACRTGYNEWSFVFKRQLIFAAVASSLAQHMPFAASTACLSEAINPVGCHTSLISVSAFVSTYFTGAELRSWEAQAVRVSEDVAALQVAITQFTEDVSGAKLFHQRLFAPEDPTMQFTSWTFAYDWAIGVREVVAFEGDVASVTVLSSPKPVSTTAASPYELPSNVAVYFRALCQYISLVLLLLALLAAVYTVLNGFTSDGRNLWKINRVGGMVWVGRPLLFLRSVTALCILSSADLSLQRIGTVSRLVTRDVTPLTIVTKVLVAGEGCWLAYIACDICMVFTREYTASYAGKAAIAVWALAALLSVFSPVTHHASIDRRCTVVTTDLQLTCASGVVTIGSRSRLLSLALIALLAPFLLYLHNRLRYAMSPPRFRPSYMLSCGAECLFATDGWVAGGVRYVDFASAALTGLLVLPYKHRIYVFDIKTWRLLVLDSTAPIERVSGQVHLLRALPCVE
ncbi:hypothetical protein SPRG_13421 [Saprolegnia parasitica CBS 223.65]|uniref:Uncharacterized protein n=1 Tax=Saprolegnia parasitica (strain CBS 223.65) TaxID=695850 RepID=A0A067BQD3_SAPPC|nr:hypothetical protein SPRG_13421 [Saprolegnia parasitica CBS 223.65]KDO20669.1 hypothetical protein SPRG_13421 [Saprolegnia parasitica CBS 223.65]|eukprot:XP_012208634.1 hypothetical protein SPRG_13421 [Saprolegnia parasitica CBS 223.65]